MDLSDDHRKCVFDVLTCFCRYFDVTHVPLLGVLHSFVVVHLSVWQVALVANKHDHYVLIAVFFYFIVPFFQIVKRLLVRQIKNQECAAGALKEYA